MFTPAPDPWSELAKVGAVYGAFFFAQSFGYSAGAGIERPKSLHEAVENGMRHLSHIFLPWCKTAVPLCPFLCGLLLLYAPYLPSQLADSSATGPNTWFCAALVGSTAPPLTGVVLGDWLVERWAKTTDSWRVCLFKSALYLAIVATLTVGAHTILPKIGARTSFSNAPWCYIAAAAVVGWLLFASYVGSVFDGKLDRMTGAILKR